MFEAKEIWDMMVIEAEESGLDLEDICRRAGVSEKRVYEWSRGDGYPSGKWFRKLRSTFVEMMEEHYRPA